MGFNLGQAIGQSFNALGKGIQSSWNKYVNSAQSIGNFFKHNVSSSDAIIPGITATDNLFDITGKHAAETANSAQWALQKDAQQFNASEAEKARQFEADQANTAYQRAVADMKAAGLNPYWISSMNSAQTASGSSASSSQGSSSMANNKLAVAAGLIATALRMFLTKGK